MTYRLPSLAVQHGCLRWKWVVFEYGAGKGTIASGFRPTRRWAKAAARRAEQIELARRGS